MKRNINFVLLISSLVLIMGACQKTLEKDYLNPELTTNGSIGKLFSGMLLNNRIHSSYWDYYTFNFTATGTYSQMHATSPSDQMYIPNPDYMSSRWTDYYAGSMTNNSPDYNYSGPGILSNYSEMEKTYATLSSADQKDNEVFLKVANVIVADQTSQLIDLWGDVPFFQSNSLNKDRSVTNAPFDDAAIVYDTLLLRLNELNDYFDTANLSQVALSGLKQQDLIYNGNLDNWRRYTNSLRLRLLMRLSFVDEAKVKPLVMAMLANPSKYPLLDDNQYNAQLKMSPTNLNSDVQGAIGLAPYAPAYLLDTVMQANNDPRLPVFWSKNKSGEYKGFPSNGTAAQYTAAATARSLSTFDSSTFIYNYNIPGVLFNAAETDFLKAEAFERWGGGDASVAYYAGIEQSISFYFGINQSHILKSLSWNTLPNPNSAAISAYKAKADIAYTGSHEQRLRKIWTQKWEHFFILQAQQAWAEIRRTGYPKLPIYRTSFSGGELPPSRLLYPQSEAQYNASNYSKVADKDKRDTKVFWDVQN
ncbi:MAG TPA: SusD/RagB family nutrient-binding outer membrane lipoprotein [Arachidicoccus sp.]|nr:SusD/RagB family nutrient-binding outer membrane lipoprotein [Arachidicoccus sp.]